MQTVNIKLYDIPEQIILNLQEHKYKNQSIEEIINLLIYDYAINKKI